MSDDPISLFRQERKDREARYPSTEMAKHAKAFLQESAGEKYSYNFDWLGRPIIQYPQDIVALQEVIWRVKPDLIIETGIAHGGSLILSASLLALLDLFDAQSAGEMLDPSQPKRRVFAIDIDIRAHNRTEIEAHPLANRIEMIEGSSVAPDIVAIAREKASQACSVLVILDSNHTHDHVLRELEAYAPMVSVGSYCIVMDTVIEEQNADTYPDRNWGPGDSPQSAVHAYLRGLSDNDPSFEIDRAIDDKLLISVAPQGFLARTA